MNTLLAHFKTKDSLDAIIASPTACYMLVGAPRSGRMASGLYVASQLHCGGQEGCAGCRRIMTGSDPDTLRIAPNEKGTITIEMAHNLVGSLSKHANRLGATRIVIIQSAERMTTAAQNALLKVIEEPPANTLFMLVLEDRRGVLPTIVSRCQTVYVRPVSDQAIREYGGPQLVELARNRAGLVMDILNAPESLGTQMDIRKDTQARANTILSVSTFERMILVDELAKSSDLKEIIDNLAYNVLKSAREQNASSQALQSMQKYFIYGNAGVAAKHALTEMMIRL